MNFFSCVRDSSARTGGEATCYFRSVIMSKIELKLSRANRVYRPSEPIQGTIIVTLASSISHNGVRITANGAVNLQVRGGMTGVIESLYTAVKPISIVNKSSDVRSSGRLDAGRTEIPFSLILTSQRNDGYERCYETFHGTNISIQI